MLGLHEPRRRVGANGEDGDINARESLSDALKDFRSLRGVASEIDCDTVRLKDKATLQRSVSAERAAHGPVVGWGQRDAEPWSLDALPPVLFRRMRKIPTYLQ